MGKCLIVFAYGLIPSYCSGRLMTIRTANNDDRELIARVIRDAYRTVAERFDLTAENCPKHPSNCTVDWIDKDLSRGVIYYIVEIGNRAVGCAALERPSSELTYLERLAVLPEYRCKGYGRALVDHVLVQAALLGSNTISIGIIAEQYELKEWYQRFGFIEGETKPFKHLPFLVTFMQRTLQQPDE